MIDPNKHDVLVSDTQTLALAVIGLMDLDGRLRRMTGPVAPYKELAFGISSTEIGVGVFKEMVKTHTIAIVLQEPEAHPDDLEFPGVLPADLAFLMFESAWSDEVKKYLCAAMMWAADAEANGLDDTNRKYMQERCRKFMSQLVFAGKHHGWKKG